MIRLQMQVAKTHEENSNKIIMANTKKMWKQEPVRMKRTSGMHNQMVTYYELEQYDDSLRNKWHYIILSIGPSEQELRLSILLCNFKFIENAPHHV